MGKKKIPNINDYSEEAESQTAKDKAGVADKAADLEKTAKDAKVKEKPASGEKQNKKEKTKKLTGLSDKKATKGSKTETESKAETKENAKKTSAKNSPKVAKQRSKHYREMKAKIEASRNYKMEEAVALLLSLGKSKLDETIEIHLSTLKDKVSGEVKLPHGTGKTQKIAIFDDAVLKNLEAGKTEFNVLLAKPTDMPKLAKFARILGPKGLFPNPKNGTVTADPEKAAKEMSGGKTRYKTEPKAPLVHFTLGKKSFGEKKLTENLEAFIKAVGPKQIIKATLSATQSPSIKLEIV